MAPRSGYNNTQMPANPDHYRTRGGNLAIVLCCPTIVSPARLVYFDHNPEEAGVIRDFIIARRLDNETSDLTLADIEQAAIHSEPPPWCSVVESPQDWRLYLELRTTVYTEQRDRRMNLLQPNGEPDRWRPL